MSMSLMVLSLLHPPIYAQWEILQTMKTFSPNQLHSRREKKGNTGLEGKCPHMPVSLFLPLAIHTYVDAIFWLPLAEPIIISDSDGNGSSHHDDSGSGAETEHELPLHIAKCPWGAFIWPIIIQWSYIFNLLDLVHSPDHTGGNTGLDLSASVSSLCLEEVASSSVMPSTFALGAWANLRKASAPFFVDGTKGETSFEFWWRVSQTKDRNYLKCVL